MGMASELWTKKSGMTSAASQGNAVWSAPAIEGVFPLLHALLVGKPQSPKLFRGQGVTKSMVAGEASIVQKLVCLSFCSRNAKHKHHQGHAWHAPHHCGKHLAH